MQFNPMHPKGRDGERRFRAVEFSVMPGLHTCPFFGARQTGSRATVCRACWSRQDRIFQLPGQGIMNKNKMRTYGAVIFPASKVVTLGPRPEGPRFTGNMDTRLKAEDDKCGNGQRPAISRPDGQVRRGLHRSPNSSQHEPSAQGRGAQGLKRDGAARSTQGGGHIRQILRARPAVLPG
jgi:hypothetical protein